MPVPVPVPVLVLVLVLVLHRLLLPAAFCPTSR